MRLVLKVLMSPEGCGLEGQTQTFEERGGSFGRGPANQWILPDPSRHISSVHGKILFSTGQFFLQDASTNGIYLNEEEFPVGQGNQVPISNGDQLAFGEYVLEVQLDEQQAFSADTLVPSFANSPQAAPEQPRQDDNFDDLDKWLDPVSPHGSPEPSTPAMGGFSSDSGKNAKLDSDLMGGAPPSQDPLAALDGAGQKDNWSSQTPGSNDFSLDDLLGSPAAPQSAPASSAQQDRMNLGKIVPSETDNSFNETMVRPQEASPEPSPQPSAPEHKDNLSLPQEPVAKSEDLLADELDSFLSGAELKAPPPATPPAPAPAPEPELPPEDIIKADAIPTEAPWEHELQPLASPASNPTLPPEDVEPEPDQSVFPELRSTSEFSSVPESPAISKQASSLPPPSAPAEPLISVTGDNNVVLAGKLGLNELPASAMATLSDQIAAVVKETVNGLMLNLRARNQIKSEFRLNMTMIQAAENNPLKFSVTPEDAMENMFAKTGKAYMPPVEAVQDSFADIGDHQVALFDAMRTAYDNMLTQFDPEKIESMSPNIKSRKFLGGKKDIHWEQYKHYYQQMMQDRELTFKRSFGEVFAESYERRMQELKAARFKSGK